MATDVLEVESGSLVAAEWPEYVVAFREALDSARDGLAKAAEIYVAAIDEDPGRAQEFRAALPYIPERTWGQFEAIGRHQIDPRLLLGDGGPHRERIKRLPYTTQRSLLEGEPVELLIDEGDVLRADVRSLTQGQAAQVFAGDHVRTAAEQKAWLLDQERRMRLTKGEPEDTLPYLIRGSKVTFRKNLTMTLKELKDLIQVMAG